MWHCLLTEQIFASLGGISIVDCIAQSNKNNIDYSLLDILQPSLQFLVGGIHFPGEFRELLALLLGHVTQEILHLVVLVLPRAEHLLAGHNDLLELVVRHAHQMHCADHLNCRNGS